MLGGTLFLFIVPHMVTASIITLHHNPGNDIFWQSTQDHPDEPPYWSVRLFVTVDLNMCTEDERRVFFQIPTTAWLICSHAYLVHRDQLATHELFPQHSTFEDKRAFRPRCLPLLANAVEDVPIWIPPELGLGSMISVSVWLERSDQTMILGLETLLLFGSQQQAAQANITSQLWCGLGNQFYTIYSTIAYALRYGLNFHFENARFSITPTDQVHRETYFSTVFRALQKHLVPPQQSSAETPEVGPLRLVADGRGGVQHIAMPPPPKQISSILQVHWQLGPFLHFHAEALHITELLGLPEMRQAVCGKLRPLVPTLRGGAESISLHLRMGDLKRLRLGAGDAEVLPDEYYTSALLRAVTARDIGGEEEHSAMAALMIDIVAFYELEDEALARSRTERIAAAAMIELQQLYTDRRVSVHTHYAPTWMVDYSSLFLMSCCDNHVIATSSFSWWAAYLHEIIATDRNDRPPIVVYPANWRTEHLKHEVLYPETWIPVAYTSGKWRSVGAMDNSTRATILHPLDGAANMSLPIRPVVNFVVGDDEAGGAIRSSVYDFDVCIALDDHEPRCTPISQASVAPALTTSNGRAQHHLCAFFRRRDSEGRGGTIIGEGCVVFTSVRHQSGEKAPLV